MAPSTALLPSLPQSATPCVAHSLETRGVTRCGSLWEPWSSSPSSSGRSCIRHCPGWCANVSERHHPLCTPFLSPLRGLRDPPSPRRTHKLYTPPQPCCRHCRVPAFFPSRLGRPPRQHRLQARGIRSMDNLATHQLPPRCRWHQHFPDPSDYLADPRRHSGFVERHQASRQGISHHAPPSGDGRDRHLSLSRPVSLLPFLGIRPDSPGLPDRHLGP